MPVSRRRYLHYDVFTDRRFGGNQLAVFPDADGLPPVLMQQIANEVGFAVDRAVSAAAPLETAVYLFTTERGGAADKADTYSRMFAPDIGVIEDAATGSAAGPLGRHGTGALIAC